MNISLRKASALQNSINDAVKSIAMKTEISINEFQNHETELASALATLHSELARKDALTAVLYEIRKAVSIANHSAGVYPRLADLAQCDSQIQTYSALAGKEVCENMDVIKGKLDKIRNRKDDTRSIYGFEGSVVTTSVLEAKHIRVFKEGVSLLKKTKQKLQDEVLELNVRTEIQLTSSSVQTLTQEGLL